jgi:lipid A 3-O-deacylase
MKHFLLSIYMLCFAAGNYLLQAQSTKDTATLLLRFYEDNDFINLYLKGTDDAYTNGSRIDLFYLKKNKPRFFVDRWMPKAGDSSSDIYGWGITQLMFTPSDLTTSVYQPDDYPYSGALFATHTLYSYNPVKKYDLQTELLLGVSGPASFTKQSQTFIHRLINDHKPMGWAHQAKNALLLNLNFTAEKQLAAYDGWFETIVGSQVRAGTMGNGFSIYPEIRIGMMAPYFNGYISQYSKSRHQKAQNKIQAYLFAKPQTLLVLSDELLQGKASETTSKDNRNAYVSKQASKPYHEINNLVYYFSYGAVLTSGHFSISFTQTSNKALLKGLYNHAFGNISLYFSW